MRQDQQLDQDIGVTIEEFVNQAEQGGRRLLPAPLCPEAVILRTASTVLLPAALRRLKGRDPYSGQWRPQPACWHLGVGCSELDRLYL
jgi:hypothetical protein